MKSLMLHVHDDDGMEERLQIALDLARGLDAHLTCLQVSPLAGYMAVDALGGVYAGMPVMVTTREDEARTRERFEKRLSQEDVRWEWASAEGDVVQSIARAAALTDLLILGQFRGYSKGDRGTLAIVDDVVVAAGCPVLVVPEACRSFDLSRPVVIGWNGSAEAAHAIRAAMPLLVRSGAVHIVSVGNDADAFPQTEASAYCARHGVKTQMHMLPGSPSHAGAAIASFAGGIGAGLIVIGAFGRSRLRETILGGTTRSMLDGSEIPLMLGR